MKPAQILQADQDASYVYEVVFEQYFSYPSEEVWAMLTDNSKLQQWFSELSIAKLEKGSYLQFDMGNGHYEYMDILTLEPLQVFEFAWDADSVRFELQGTDRDCKLVLREKLSRITKHTARDVAGWHVCLEMIEAILGKSMITNRKERWQQVYEDYSSRFDALLDNSSDDSVTVDGNSVT